MSLPLPLHLRPAPSLSQYATPQPPPSTASTANGGGRPSPAGAAAAGSSLTARGNPARHHAKGHITPRQLIPLPPAFLAKPPGGQSSPPPVSVGAPSPTLLSGQVVPWSGQNGAHAAGATTASGTSEDPLLLGQHAARNALSETQSLLLTSGSLMRPHYARVHRLWAHIVRQVEGHLTHHSAAGGFRSPTIRCEAILAEVERQLALDGAGAPPDAERQQLHRCLRAGAAAWVLSDLAASAGNDVLRDVKGTLFEFMFDSYSEARNARPSIAASTAEAASASLSTEWNPLLACDLYLCLYDDSAAEGRRLLGHLQRAVQANSAYKYVVQNVLARMRRPLMLLPFRAWRVVAKHAKVERFRQDIERRRGDRELRHYQLEVAMCRWRVCVERSRSAVLTERIGTLENSLENARNQFNIQCFRSDKYLRTVEELRDDVLRLTLDRDALIDEVEKLKVDIQEFETRSRDLRNSDITSALTELTKWRSFARQAALREHQRAATLSLTTEHEADLSASTLEGDDAENVHDSSDASSEMRLTTDLLLRWCNEVIRQSPVGSRSVQRITNFTNDFQSGELVLLIMHHVAPAQVPLAPMQEPHATKRAEMICEIGKQLGVAYMPTSSEIIQGTGDMIMLFVGEMFMRYLSSNRVSRVATDALSDGGQLPQIQYDCEMLSAVLADVCVEFDDIKKMTKDSIDKDLETWKVQQAIQHFMAFMSRERLAGRPVAIVDPKDVARFCKVVKPRYGDIAFRYKTAPIDYNGTWLAFELQLEHLRLVLRKNYHELRKVFTFYCSGRPVMAAADFWRLCSDVRMQDRNLSRLAMERMFAIANSDELPVGASSASAALALSNGDGGMGGDEEDDGAEEAEEEENTTTELVPSEFVECLVRMSDVKFPGKMLHERFQAMMTQTLLPYACKNDTDKFMREVQLPETQVALQRYHKDLNKVFAFYGKPSAHGGGKRTKMMTLPDFTAFVKDALLLGGGLDEDCVATVFTTLSSSPEDIVPREINLHEFVHAVVCLAAYKVPSPFAGLDKKVDVMVSSLIQTLRHKLKGVVNLSDVPLISLAR